MLPEASVGVGERKRAPCCKLVLLMPLWGLVPRAPIRGSKGSLKARCLASACGRGLQWVGDRVSWWGCRFAKRLAAGVLCSAQKGGLAVTCLARALLKAGARHPVQTAAAKLSG